MLVFLSREGVVFLFSLLSFHLTMVHVLSPPVSEANWHSLSQLWGSAPPLVLKWRLHSQGPHTLPFQGTRQWTLILFGKNNFDALREGTTSLQLTFHAKLHYYICTIVICSYHCPYCNVSCSSTEGSGCNHKQMRRTKKPNMVQGGEFAWKQINMS
jgi:hypothetical protein